MLEIIQADMSHLEEIYRLIKISIEEAYPKYYPDAIVRIFFRRHSRENIQKEILAGRVFVALMDGHTVGAASYDGNEITRLFVTPGYQGKGVGSGLLHKVEETLAKEYDVVWLESSLAGVRLYEKLGYHTVRHDKWTVETGEILIYPIMEKEVKDIR